MTTIIGASGADGIFRSSIPIVKRIGGLRQIVYTTYILQSEKDNSYYIGSCENFKKRIEQHNKGYSRYTKSKRPLRVVYKKNYETLSEAKKREYYLKSLKSRVAIEKLIKSDAIV